MASNASNRYALFVDNSENGSPKERAEVDVSHNPFLNQVADDSIPWQEVKKKGAPAAPAVQPPPVSKAKVLAIRAQAKHAATPANPTSRVRTASASTADPSEKNVDPHENWCGVCSLKFANKAALLNHIKQSPEHKHYCNLCKRVFKDRNGIKNHLDNSLGHDVFCNLCLSAFNDEWGLKNHFENNYNVGHEFACLTCLLGFRSRTELERHLQTAKKHTWCEHCKRSFRNQDERDAHWRKTTKHKHCLQPGCDYDGPDDATLNLHLQQDHFQCVGCERILPSQNKLNQHVETCKSSVACHQCGLGCAGQVQLALHLEHCFLCDECNYWTHHEGNYQIHMTKHASATISCWGCDAPMRTYSSLINHLESGRCSNFPDPSRLIRCLGMWWYSPLYMDLDLHAQLRTGRIDPGLMRQWMDGGALYPFLCRAEGCQKTFGHMSSLMLHCESQACEWDVARLNILGLEKEVKRMMLRRDSATA